MDERLKVYDSKMTKSFDALLRDYAAIRAGRANPHVLDKIKVDYYGTPTPLQQVGNISVPEARIIQIQPWEKKLIREIEKAIMTSDLGINPTNDGTSIRLIFPELTEERRKGIASFRMLSFGDLSHLYVHGEVPAFAARFCEVYENENERHD